MKVEEVAEGEASLLPRTAAPIPTLLVFKIELIKNDGEQQFNYPIMAPRRLPDDPIQTRKIIPNDALIPELCPKLHT